MEPSNENSVGPVVGLVIILAIIILGGLYFWGERQKTLNPSDSTQQTASTNDSLTASIETQSSSDDVDSIQADLNNTHTETLDAELNAS